MFDGTAGAALNEDRVAELEALEEPRGLFFKPLDEVSNASGGLCMLIYKSAFFGAKKMEREAE